MDRGPRRTAPITLRKHRSESASSRESASEHPSAGGPVKVNTVPANSPQTATRSRRGSKVLQHAFSFSSTPDSRNRGEGVKKRSRTMDGYAMPEDAFDEDSPRKGGHTLRKRARVDYTFEHVEDDVVVPNSTSSTRTKKRRSDNSYDSEDFYGSGAKRRGASLGADTPSSRRRRSTHKPAVGVADNGDDDNVKDTIEVGVSLSDLDESEVRRGSHSSASSAGHSQDGSWKSAPAASHYGSLHSNDKSNSGNDNENENETDPVVSTGPQTSAAVSPRQIPAERLVTAPSDDGLEKPEDQLAQESAEHQLKDAMKDASGPLSKPEGQAQDTNTVDPNIDPSLTSLAPSEEATARQPAEAPVSVSEEAVALPVPVEEDTKINQELNVEEAEQETAKSEEASDLKAVEETSEKDESAPLSQVSGPVQIEKAEELGTAKSPTPIPHITEEEGHKDDNDDSAKEDGANAISVSVPKQAPSEETTTEEDGLVAAAQGVEENSDEQPTASQELPSVEQDVNMEDVPEVTRETIFDVPKVEISAPDDAKLSPDSSSVDSKEKGTELSDAAAALSVKDAYKPKKPSQLGPSKPQPAPAGRWAHLTPYMDGEYVSYPEKKARPDDDAAGDDTPPEDKDGDKEDKDDKDTNDMEPMVEDNDDAPDPVGIEAPTPALNTPTRGSPVPDSMDPTATNSPAPGGDDGDDGDVSDSQEQPETRRYFKYRKLRDPEEYITAIENYEDMSTAELYEILEAINVSLTQWQTEWTDLGRVVDDYENSLRRRVADSKYESRTRNLGQHGVNHEEPDFQVKGYKAKEKELMSETRYLQGQDRIMAAVYGFEYDPHPSKIGKQNPETQQVGIMTRGRSLRNQPRQTAKATETDEVTGKRARKPVQLYDPATQDVSRSSTPVPTRGRRRRNLNADNEDGQQPSFASSFNGDGNSDNDSSAPPKTRRRRGPRASNMASGVAEEFATPRGSEGNGQEEPGRSGRRRGRQPVRYDDTFPDFLDDDSQAEPKHRRRHLLTLKIPRSKQFSEPDSAITDNGDSRPSTASSDSTSHTAESSYSFRPKRQKRFRDDPDGTEEIGQAPPRKRGKRSVPHGAAGMESSFSVDPSMTDAHQNRKVQKIKVVRPGGDGRNGTPSSQAGGDGDDKPKDYKNMTKSEKMSASMKSRWANGNMAGAVEKRKATLAAKKAAQAAAEQKMGVIAPKPKAKPNKKEPHFQGQQPPTGYVQGMPGIGYPFSANQ